ncbi:MAG: diversity-generating retroelement protein Avd [Desulfobacteraceae bacterium]|nr:diversity-generating retroelement protein Avd [Desulfobacteraceae bacterium]
MSKKYKESPIFVKTFDFLKWILGHTEKFPKSQRFFLAKRINDAIFDFYEILVEAARLKSRNQVQKLKHADAELFKLKHYTRLSMEMGYISFKQYEHASRQLEEIGRLLGGWLKKTSE